MTDLVYTPTEARKEFFKILKIARAGKRRVMVRGRKAEFEVILRSEKEAKKPNWEDFFGKGNKKVANDILKAKKLVDKVSIDSIKTW